MVAVLVPIYVDSERIHHGWHGQIRFVFHPGKRPRILGLDGEPLSGVAPLDDLIISWEA